MTTPKERTPPPAPGRLSAADVATAVLLVAAVLFLAGAGAGVFPATVWTVAGVCSLVYLVRTLRSPPPPDAAAPAPAPGGDHVLAAALVFLLLTILPLPHAVSPLTGPRRNAENARVADALEYLAARGEPAPAPARFSLSRNRGGTGRIVLLLAAALPVFMLARRLPAAARKPMLRVMTAAGGVLAVAGYISQYHVPQGDTLWWWIEIPHGLPGPVAGFVNRNHYAGFLALLCPAALACGLDDLGRRRFAHAALSAALFAVMSAALVLSLSRGALLAYAAGLLVLPLLFLSRRRLIAAAGLVAVLAVVASAILNLPHDGLQQRIDSMTTPADSESLAKRLDATRTCLRIWRAYPVSGAGANAFRFTFPVHRTTSTRAYRVHAENEYAQLLAETGAIGLVLLSAGAFALGWRFVAAARRRFAPAAWIAALGALAAAGVHATVEFTLHAPVYTVGLALLTGLALPCDETSSRRSAAWPAAVCAAAVLILLPILIPLRQYDDPHHVFDAELPELARILPWTPVAAHAWYRLGTECRRRGDPALQPLAAAALAHAGACDPNNYVLWLRIGKQRLRLKDYRGAREAFKRVKALRHWVTTPEVPDA